MSLKEILQESPILTIQGFQKLQDSYDERFISETFTGFDKVRHTYAHMGKLIGRLADYVHDKESGIDVSPKDIVEKVIPDLLVYSAWLSHEFGVNIETAYLKRFVGNIKRLHADKISPDELAGLEEYVQERIKTIGII